MGAFLAHSSTVMSFPSSSVATPICPRRPLALRSAALRRGFTLMEIMVALAILGLLVGLAITNLGGMFEGGRRDVASLFVNSSLTTPLNTYRIHMSDYPTTAEGLQALAVAPSTRADRWRGPYVTENKWPPLDPWGEPYQYRSPGTHNKAGYDLWSKGPDKQDGTPDDIGNWAATTEQK